MEIEISRPGGYIALDGVAYEVPEPIIDFVFKERNLIHDLRVEISDLKQEYKRMPVTYYEE